MLLLKCRLLELKVNVSDLAAVHSGELGMRAEVDQSVSAVLWLSSCFCGRIFKKSNS